MPGKEDENLRDLDDGQPKMPMKEWLAKRGLKMKSLEKD